MRENESFFDQVIDDFEKCVDPEMLKDTLLFTGKGIIKELSYDAKR